MVEVSHHICYGIWVVMYWIAVVSESIFLALLQELLIIVFVSQVDDLCDIRIMQGVPLKSNSFTFGTSF